MVDSWDMSTLKSFAVETLIAQMGEGIMKKYFVTVGEDKTVRFYKDEACKILHREDGPAAKYANGDKAYYIEGELHREDGAAIEFAKGDKFYYIEGELHREDGPAVVFSNGSKEYWIHGRLLSEEYFLARNKKDPCDGKVVEIDGKKYKLSLV